VRSANGGIDTTITMERYHSRASVGMTRLDVTPITCRGRPLNISTGAVITTISGQRENTVSEYNPPWPPSANDYHAKAEARIAQLEAALVKIRTELRGAGPSCSREFAEMAMQSAWQIAGEALDQRPAERHT
jgi:hypothetical protein